MYKKYESWISLLASSILVLGKIGNKSGEGSILAINVKMLLLSTKAPEKLPDLCRA